jgi:hypothetical protein
MIFLTGIGTAALAKSAGLFLPKMPAVPFAVVTGTTPFVFVPAYND